ncbi:Hsp20/alpha crystallin family protein [Magnetococcales bacterium HHB-1]
MAIVHYDPFRGIRQMQREFNQAFGHPFFEGETSAISDGEIRVDIKEGEDALILRADMPGMNQKDIDVHVENGRLTISGARQFSKEEKRKDFHLLERAYGRFSRAFQLPSTTDASHIKAKYKAGVLEVSIPKKEQAKPQSIQISVEE